MVTVYGKEDCPRCFILTKKLENAGIEYTKVYDVSVMEKLGIDMLPVIVSDGVRMEYGDAVKWIKENGSV